MIDMWLARHTPEKVLPLLHKVVEGAKEEFADAIANGGGIYAIGYCFGAKYVLLLGSEQSDPAAEAPKDEEEQGAAPKIAPLIKAGALAHGTLITAEDLDGVKVPISMACVEDDTLFPEEVLEAGRKSLEKNKVEHEVEVYKNVPHGMRQPRNLICDC
jgi:dienelactone hydrolase